MSTIFVTSPAEVHAAPNNPGNIEHSSIPWKGKVECAQPNRFECFATPKDGLRALVKNLHTYMYKHGLWTVEEIIHRWAPPHENDTSGYVEFIRDRVCARDNSNAGICSYIPIFELVRGIILIEQGEAVYTEEEISEVIEDVYGPNPPLRGDFSGRLAEAVGDEAGVPEDTGRSSPADGRLEGEGQAGREGVEREVRPVDKASNCSDGRRLNHCTSEGSRYLYGLDCDLWNSRMEQWFPILHRREGCCQMDNHEGIGDNSPRCPSRPFDYWALFRRVPGWSWG